MFSEIFDNSIKGQNVWGRETICELHREIYDLLVVGLYKSNPELLKLIVPILERAYTCGIKMNGKMVQHRCQIEGWEDHLDKAEVIRIRQVRKHLIKELERIHEVNTRIRSSMSKIEA
jgi:hypothetical protein